MAEDRITIRIPGEDEPRRGPIIQLPESEEGVFEYTLTGFEDEDFERLLNNTTTDELAEGTSNLYFKESRVVNTPLIQTLDSNISSIDSRVSTIETDGVFTGDNISRLINDEGYLTSIPSIYIEDGDNISRLNNDTGFITGLTSFSTDDLSEGANLYYLTERVQDDVASFLTFGNSLTGSYDDNLNLYSVNLDVPGFNGNFLYNENGELSNIPVFRYTSGTIQLDTDLEVDNSSKIDFLSGNAAIGRGLLNSLNSLDFSYPRNGALRFGATPSNGFSSGPAFQAFGEDGPFGLGGNMYFDFGSRDTTIGNAQANFRYLSTSGSETIFQLTPSVVNISKKTEINEQLLITQSTGQVTPILRLDDENSNSLVTVNPSGIVDAQGFTKNGQPLGAVAGSDTEIQFNDGGGDLGASSRLTYDGETFLVQAESGQTQGVFHVKKANGDTALFVDKNGKVGIGTDGPLDDLDIGGLRFSGANKAINITGSGGFDIQLGKGGGLDVAIAETTGGYLSVGPTSASATITAQAQVGQTDPLLQLNDGGGLTRVSVPLDQGDITLHLKTDTGGNSSNVTDSPLLLLEDTGGWGQPSIKFSRDGGDGYISWSNKDGSHGFDFVVRGKLAATLNNGGLKNKDDLGRVQYGAGSGGIRPRLLFDDDDNGAQHMYLTTDEFNNDSTIRIAREGSSQSVVEKARFDVDGHFAIGTTDTTATITAQADVGQTEPLLQLNDENGNELLSYDPTDGFRVEVPDRIGRAGIVVNAAGGNGVSSTTFQNGNVGINSQGNLRITTDNSNINFLSSNGTSRLNGTINAKNLTLDATEKIKLNGGEGVQINAIVGQTEPILQLNDENGNGVFSVGADGATSLTIQDNNSPGLVIKDAGNQSEPLIKLVRSDDVEMIAFTRDNFGTIDFLNGGAITHASSGIVVLDENGDGVFRTVGSNGVSYLQAGPTQTAFALGPNGTADNWLNAGTDGVFIDGIVGDGRLEITASTGQTDPILQFNDENGSRIGRFDTDGRYYGEGIVSENSNTGMKVTSGPSLTFDCFGRQRLRLHASSGVRITPAAVNPGSFEMDMVGASVPSKLEVNPDTGTFDFTAGVGQTDPLLQLNDENGDALFIDDVSGSREYTTAGEGVILTTPDGTSQFKITIDNSGNIQSTAI